MANNILKYTSKDYNSIFTDLVDAIPALTDLWTSREDGDPGIVLVKLMSALGDMISYNFDKQALEYYAPTVTQRKNAQKLFNLVGYNMHWYRAAVTQITVTNKSTMPEYIVYLKQVVDIANSDLPDSSTSGADSKESEIDKVITEYKNAFGVSATDPNTICVPPVINTSGDIEIPNSMLDAINNGVDFSEYENYGYSNSLRRFSLPESATPWESFKVACQVVYSYWQRDNAYLLRTFIADPNRSLEVYSNDSSGIVYSLIPTTEGHVTNNVYEPTLSILPYEPTNLKAIQGYLCSTTFTTSQLKDGCFYVPDSNLDETYMYLSYQTTEGNNTVDVPIFISKSDNLLLETDGELHFQFKVDEFDYPYIELSSYWKTFIGDSNVTFTFYYFRTLGKNGVITNNYLTRMNSGSQYLATVTNLANTEYVVDSDGNIICAPGFNPQTAGEAYIDSQNYIMTYYTLVTIYDFQRYSKRLAGISNSFACDGQYAEDLNKEIKKTCNSYTKAQLLNILGNLPVLQSKSREDLAQYLYNIRKINADYKDNCVTYEQAQHPSETASGNAPKEFEKYNIQIYPIWEDYVTKSEETGVDIAIYNNLLTSPPETPDGPYMLYRIYNPEDDPDINPDSYAIATYLDNEFDKCKIVNRLPKYTAVRVFPWRLCGTLHLTKSVSQEEGNNIIQNVINTLRTVYAPENMTMGEKINYMSLIDVVMSSDSRIRYFDAGIGDKKLIDFENLNPIASGTYFKTESYFNPISIMRYVQRWDELVNTNSPYYNYITIDPAYIQTSYF